MKKTYIAPNQKVANIELEGLIATSPNINGGPGVAQQSITDDLVDEFQMDAKKDNLWDNLW